MGHPLPETLRRRDEETLAITTPVSVLFGLFALLLVSRVLFLDAKPYHHDESLYAIESWRYAKNGIYRFNPMLHGPFLFHLQAAFFEIFSVNNFTGRLPPVFFGLLLPVFSRSFFPGWKSLSYVFFLLFLLTSPVFTYFSRFLGMDVLIACLSVALLDSVLRLQKTGNRIYLYDAAVFLALMLCTKLNSVLYLFSFLTFIPVWMVWGEELPKKKLFSETWARIILFLKRYHVHAFTSLVLVGVVFSLLFSSLTRNWGGVLDGLYRKMIPYWVEQHRIQRIRGPFDYYVPILLTYELPLVICLLTFACKLLFQNWRKALFSISLITFITSFASDHFARIKKFLAPLHLEDAGHIALLLSALFGWHLIVRWHCKRKEPLLAFLVHWGATSLLLYSYAGEKVPWLTTHIVLPWMFYIPIRLASFFESTRPRKLLKVALALFLAVCFTWQGYISYRSSFLMAANPKERLVYTHTSWDIDQVVKKVETLRSEDRKGGFQIQVIGDSAWPLYWYFRDTKQWYQRELQDTTNTSVVICDWSNKDAFETKLSGDFEMERFKLREWWVPDTKDARWRDYIDYYISRNVFSVLGSQDIAVFVRKNLVSLWRHSSS